MDEKMADRDLPRAPEPRLVFAADSLELHLLRETFRRSAVVGLDAEWRPSSLPTTEGRESAAAPSFPVVTLLQIACRAKRDSEASSRGGDVDVFLVDLLSVPLPAVYDLLRELFVAPDVLKLGFMFKQDLVNLSSTFRSQGCDSGFDRVEPFLDIRSVYHHLINKKFSQKTPKETKSLATICEELLHVSLSKELQCSDWSCRPLTREQIVYAAADAYFLLEIFGIFEGKFLDGGKSFYDCYSEDFSPSTANLKCRASDVVESSFRRSCVSDETTSYIVAKYSERIQLNELDKVPRKSKGKGKRESMKSAKFSPYLEDNRVCEDSLPWDLSSGSNECPKFLCDAMVEGLARHLRCVGIDAAIPSSRKPDPRQLLDQAYKEKRVLLTRDSKLLKYQYLYGHQIYVVKNLRKNDQLLEVIESFRLKISEEQLMTRCTKCNGSFIQKPLTIEEAVSASKGFQVIPKCLLNRETVFWQCRSCKQLYWEGTQYQNAVQKFITICRLCD